MVTRKMKVTNDLGLHARSILDLLLLGASTGSVIEVTAAGEDEERAIAAITALVLEGFGETGLEKEN